MVKSVLNEKNEKIKEEYKKYLKTSRKYKTVEDTAKTKLSHVNKFDEFCKYQDFSDYKEDDGIAFYDYLKEQDIDLKTVFKYLYSVKEFLSWYFYTHKVRNQKALIDSLNVLDPTDEDKRLANRITYVEYPTLEEFNKIIDFEEKTIEDKRDKAIICFLYISCARIGAISTTSIELIDLDNMIYHQDPLMNVKTKRKKYILTKLLPFEQKYYEILKNWIEYLKTEHGFTNQDPLFPKIKRTYNKEEDVKKDFMDGESEYNKMLEKRCLHAGIKKYNPHAFRHFGIHEALKRVRTGTQLKALSQNVGHEDICTVLEQYSNMRPEIYMNIVDKMISAKHEPKNIDNISTLDLIDILKERLSIENPF